jgi:hypothetical protein
MTSRKPIAVRAVLALLVLSVPSAFASPPRVVTDGTLQIPLADGWSGSVGPGFQRVRGYTYNVAWIVAGNFRFPGTPHNMRAARFRHDTSWSSGLGTSS